MTVCFCSAECPFVVCWRPQRYTPLCPLPCLSTAIFHETSPGLFPVLHHYYYYYYYNHYYYYFYYHYYYYYYYYSTTTTLLLLLVEVRTDAERRRVEGAAGFTPSYVLRWCS